MFLCGHGVNAMGLNRKLLFERLHYRYLCCDLGIDQARAKARELFKGKGITMNILKEWEKNMGQLQKSHEWSKKFLMSGIKPEEEAKS